MGHHCNESKCHSDKKNKVGCESKPISQCLVTKAKGNLAILKSGKYHLAEDVVGTISIQASNVCLDLCCHTLDANGAENAIVIGELQEAQQQQRSLNAQSVDASLKNKLKHPKRGHLGSKVFEKEIIDLSKAQRTRVKQASQSSRNNEINAQQHHIKVSNGTVCGATTAAILVSGVFDVELFDLTLLRNPLNSVHVLNSSAVNLHDLDFSIY